jgi:hypothetical protein
VNSFSALVDCVQWWEGVGYSVGLWNRGTHAKEMEMEGVSNKDCYTYTCMSRRFTVYDTNDAQRGALLLPWAAPIAQ